MIKFAYSATDAEGRVSTGRTSAVTIDAAELSLRERGLHDVELVERKGVLQIDIVARKIKQPEVMHLSRQLGAFIHAGLPLVDAVHALGSQSQNPSMRKMMAKVEDQLRSGDTLSDCLDAYPKVFPMYYRGIVRSAELTGELDIVLAQLASYLERDVEARRKVKSAMMYPAIIAVMSLVTVVVLSVFVLPKFEVFFASLDATLPLPTRMLLAMTGFMGRWWWAITLVVLLVTAIFALAGRTKRGRYLRDRLALATPVIGEAIQFAMVERFCRILSSMVGAGVSLPEALKVSTEALNNEVYSRGLEVVSVAMLEGDGLAQPMVRSGLFPPAASQMMSVGEETGTLDAQLAVTAHYYEGELDYKLQKLTGLIEPIVIIAMGIVVGFVAVALVSAMYGVFNQVQV